MDTHTHCYPQERKESKQEKNLKSPKTEPCKAETQTSEKRAWWPQEHDTHRYGGKEIGH